MFRVFNCFISRIDMKNPKEYQTDIKIQNIGSIESIEIIESIGSFESIEVLKVLKY